MSILDIREKSKPVNHIRFADGSTSLNQAALLSNGGYCLNFEEYSAKPGFLCRINFEDIDNLILALQEAKRIWGKSHE